MLTAPDLKQTASGERTVLVGEITLCYETFGSREAAPLLLVMGLASQMILWDDEFCELLAARGFWVIRFDNRDVGRSTIMRSARVPKRWQLVTRDRRAAAYSLDQMAGDAIGLLDHLEVSSAHVVGVSMGGMIAQLTALNHPDRVTSLVSIMSTTGNRRVGRPSTRIFLRLFRHVPGDREGYIEDHSRPTARSAHGNSTPTSSTSARVLDAPSIAGSTPPAPPVSSPRWLPRLIGHGR